MDPRSKNDTKRSNRDGKKSKDIKKNARKSSTIVLEEAVPKKLNDVQELNLKVMKTANSERKKK